MIIQGGGKIPKTMMFCVICGNEYGTYDTYQPSPICPECRKRIVKLLYSGNTKMDEVEE